LSRLNVDEGIVARDFPTISVEQVRGLDTKDGGRSAYGEALAQSDIDRCIGCDVNKVQPVRGVPPDMLDGGID
jgi:hypothetical protein